MELRRPANWADAEAALDQGKLFAEMTGGKFWLARRNGKTQTWKTRPFDFRIPVKCGLRSCGQLTPYTLAYFRIEVTEEEMAKAAGLAAETAARIQRDLLEMCNGQRPAGRVARPRRVP